MKIVNKVDSIKLRPIQEESVARCLDSFRAGGAYHLLQAPVAFGKTVVTSAIMAKAVVEYGAKCLFLAHLRELVEQTVDKFRRVAPELSCGVFMGQRKEVLDVTVGTRQTVGKNLEAFGVVNLIVVDEVHLWSEQYQAIVDHFLKLNPRLRVLGVTGTPFSLKEGWMYGDGKIWPEPFHATTLDDMIDLGYLSGYRYKMAETSELKNDLTGVKMVAGEFKNEELGEVMREERHMGTVRHVLDAHASDRKSVLIFAVTIEHAELLAKFLGCECVHSKLGKDEWRRRVDAFKSGETRLLVNVTQLSIGFDAPRIDCIIIARPTMSPALHVQICGRSLRVAEGKKDALIIDLVGNYVRHGLPSNPKVRSPKEKDDQAQEKEKEVAQASVCPDCLEVIEGDEIECPFCGAELTAKKEVIERHEELRLQEIEAERLAHRVLEWGEKTGHMTKRGSMGSLFWIRVTNRNKPLFRFCGSGTDKRSRVKSRLAELRTGDKVSIIGTAYGDWIA